MWARVRLFVTAVGASALCAALGGCNDSSGSATEPAPSSTAASPTIKGTPGLIAVAGRRYEFSPTAQAAAGLTLQFAISNQPKWAAFNATTGQLSGTPKAADARLYTNISIRVISGEATAALLPFSIQVLAPSGAGMQIAGSPALTVTAGATYRFQPTVTAAAGATPVYTISNPPSWAQFDTSTGVLSGTPSASDAGLYDQIAITVSAAGATASLAPFSIDVTSGSSAVATVTWAAPSGADAAEVSGYRVYYGNNAATMSRYVSIKDPTSTSYVIDNLSAGTWYFAIVSYNATQAQSPLSPTVAVTL